MPSKCLLDQVAFDGVFHADPFLDSTRIHSSGPRGPRVHADPFLGEYGLDQRYRGFGRCLPIGHRLVRGGGWSTSPSYWRAATSCPAQAAIRTPCPIPR
ncbi:hypothetical protein [Kribbella sp. NPDC051620]|uniref:hypothetical protein n=1 Tax=Kribbella sp. NPDC051620 TaxID=3364120 RepID=UPI003799B5D3